MSDFHFLIFNGIGFTYELNLIKIHLPKLQEIVSKFNEFDLEFFGMICQERLNLRTNKITIGQKVRVYDWFSASYSLPIIVEGVFTTPKITSVLSPSDFTKWLEKDMDTHNDFVTPQENLAYTKLIRTLFKQAMKSNSWVTDFHQIKKISGLAPLIAEDRLLDLEDAGFLSSSNDELRMADPLVYMMMHQINLSKKSSSPFLRF